MEVIGLAADELAVFINRAVLDIAADIHITGNIEVFGVIRTAAVVVTTAACVFRDAATGHIDCAVVVQTAAGAVDLVERNAAAGHIKRTLVVVHTAAAVESRISGDSAATHVKGAVVVEHATAAVVIGFCGSISGDRATIHMECIAVVDTCTFFIGVAGDRAVPESKRTGVVNTAACLAALVGDFADITAAVAVGNGEACTFCDRYRVLTAYTGDSLAIEAEVDVGSDLPCVRKCHVVHQIPVARIAGKAGEATPRLPFDSFTVSFAVGTIRLAADTVCLCLPLQFQTTVFVILEAIFLFITEKAGGVRCAGHNGLIERSRHTDACIGGQRLAALDRNGG